MLWLLIKKALGLDCCIIRGGQTHLGTAVEVVVVGIDALATVALTWRKTVVVAVAIGLGFHGQIVGGGTTSAGTAAAARTQPVSPVNMAAIVVRTEPRAADRVCLGATATAAASAQAAATASTAS